MCIVCMNVIVEEIEAVNKWKGREKNEYKAREKNAFFLSLVREGGDELQNAINLRR